MAVKRILFIATTNMFIRSGGGIANSALYKSLCKDYGDIIDVLHYEECLSSDVPPNYIPVPPVSSITKVRYLLMGRIHRFTPWLDVFLKENHSKYSHCIINTGLLGDYVKVLHNYGIKVAIIHHNYEVEFQLDNRKPSTFWGMSGYLVRKQELLSYRQADVNVFLTPDDQTLFHEHYYKENRNDEYVIGIFDNTKYDRPISSNSFLNRKKLCICGSLNSYQTEHGIEFFKNECLEALISYYNNSFELIIAGRNPGKDILSLSDYNSHIKVIPNPVNMTEAIDQCGIFICPTDIGGGIKLRIMDGLKLGMPILTHEKSARGYNMFYSYPWFQVFKDKQSFITGLDKIIQYIEKNPNAREAIIDAFVEHFSIEHGDSRFRKVMDSFLN